MSETIEELKRRNIELSHAMQSGVAMKLNYDSSDCAPKHLRVGVNSAMVEHAALVQVLMDKGIITEEDYFRALNKWMEKEVETYRKWLGDRLGANINLG